MHASEVERLAPSLRRLQIVAGAMAMGAVAFLLVAFVVGSRRVPASDGAGPGLITAVAMGFAVLQMVVSLILPQVSIASERKRIADGTFQPKGPGVTQAFGDLIDSMGDPARFFVLYQSRSILATALLEGAALFLGVAYMVEGYSNALILAALLVLVIALRIPTRDKMARWIEDEMRGTRGPRG